jgi:hypothetical protein
MRKTKTIPSAGKLMRAVFSDAEGCILVDFMPREETVSAVSSIQILYKLQSALHDKHSLKRHILEHNNAWPHI